MIKVIWASSAINDFVRLRDFINVNSHIAANRAALTIQEAAEELVKFPLLGKPVKNLLDYRDLFIKFGASGYILRYRVGNKTLHIVHIRHAKEIDFAKISD